MRKYILPPLVLATLVWFAWYLIQMRPQPQPREIKRESPYVEVIVAEEKSLPANLRTHGVVRPRTLTTLIAEVPGIIEGVAPFTEQDLAPSFRAGGFFRKGDLLVKIEEVDLLSTVAEAEANLRRSQLQLVQEQELAEQAKSEWGERDWKEASELVRRIPQIRKAEAETHAARAFVTQAKKNLSRAKVLAPFDGRIIRTMVGRGQRVGGGTSAALAEVYSLDSAEIDLSLSQREIDFLGFVDGSNSELSKIKVETLNREGKPTHFGLIDRSQGIVDPKTRLTNFIARIDQCFANPFSKKAIKNPLSLGTFSNLKLIGKKVPVYLLPESAFRDLTTILVVDNQNGLRSRQVEVLHRADQKVWVGSGIKNGERVCTTPIEVISEGMKVRIVGENKPVQASKKVPVTDANGSK
ncbi:efflux RND transporter periplasmic adaptor subunit [Candidatus Chordibacter forsetii]|mgnify:FL=1|uniref:efflux RND transporter periplasmic adaptor subunit n=1 Tax=Candidatus Chordibacter forsetii TaxID=3381758 RepID=UPI00389A995E